MAHLHAGQLGRQRCAFGLPGSANRGTGRKLFELLLNGGQISIDGFIEQAGLLSAELLAALAKLVALENGNLVGQLVDLALAVVQFAVFAGDGLLALGKPPGGSARSGLRRRQGCGKQFHEINRQGKRPVRRSLQCRLPRSDGPRVH